MDAKHVVNRNVFEKIKWILKWTVKLETKLDDLELSRGPSQYLSRYFNPNLYDMCTILTNLIFRMLIAL